jgi:AcrR family transcriptional regulator
MTTTVLGLRERTRLAVRAELANAAIDLFLVQGFEATTVDQIATAAGLSRRSFFRYFASKDDVLVDPLSAAGAMIADDVRTRPTGEPPWLVMRRGFDGLVEMITAEHRGLPMTRLMFETASLHASLLERQASWRSDIATALLPRMPTRLPAADRNLRADALSGAAIACLMSAQLEWVRRNGTRPLGSLVDQTMEAVGSLDG